MASGRAGMNRKQLYTWISRAIDFYKIFKPVLKKLKLKQVPHHDPVYQELPPLNLPGDESPPWPEVFVRAPNPLPALDYGNVGAGGDDGHNYNSPAPSWLQAFVRGLCKFVSDTRKSHGRCLLVIAVVGFGGCLLFYVFRGGGGRQTPGDDDGPPPPPPARPQQQKRHRNSAAASHGRVDCHLHPKELYPLKMCRCSFMIPWYDYERPIIYDVRARLNLVESTFGSRDHQMVRIGLRVLNRPLPEKLPTIYRSLGENFNERAVVAKYNTSQLITQREVVSRQMIRKILTERASNFNIALDDVSITILSFGKEFSPAIEAKQVAAQEDFRAKFIVEKPEQGKSSAIIRAQGEAKSAELIGEAINNNPVFLAVRQIEAAREISHTMASSNNKVFLDSKDLLLGLRPSLTVHEPKVALSAYLFLSLERVGRVLV
uniref:Band 7 domain-containing protein n=1 Tax=Leersia perrieri TaxID=77586 RepID=A0A0D9W0M6_9ORYZ